MDSFVLAAGSALWLGVLTSISPCPLATNVVAISYIARGLEGPRHVLLTGLLYTAGRMITYVALSGILVASLLSLPEVAYWLQTRMNQFLGPILIVAGLLMLGVIPLRLPSTGLSDRLRAKAETWGAGGAVALGVLFALSFCPVSAAIFFGSLIPLAVQANSTLALPSVYGIGTALPVFVFAILIAMGARAVGQAFQRVTQWEVWARRVTAGAFLAIGVYFILKYVLEVLD
jgi:cytochrome c-type biogenesis protein